MSKLEDLAERVDRLVLRHAELQRSAALVEVQLASVTAERDSLRSRLAAARARVDALLHRLPAESSHLEKTGEAAERASAPDHNQQGTA